MSDGSHDRSETPAVRFDPRLSFFMGATHEEALARIEYLAESGQPCGLVTGPKGTGKSTVLRAFAERSAGRFSVVRADLSGLAGAEVLERVVKALGTTSHAGGRRGGGGGGRIAALWQEVAEALSVRRYARRPSVVLFDHLDRASTDGQQVVRRFLSQHELATAATFILAFSGEKSPAVAREWRQAGELRIEVGPLTADETTAFVESLLESLKFPKDAFDADAARIIHRLTDGVPRDIVRLCELSLLSAIHDEQPTISGAIVEAAMHELSLLRPSA